MRTAFSLGPLVAVLLAAMLGLAACGGSGDEPAVASLDDAGSSGDEALAEAEGNSPEDFEEAALELVQCLRDEGINVPDPDFSAGGGGFVRGADIDPTDPAFQAAFEACQPLLEGVERQFDPANLVEIEDQLVEFAQCMREEGIDLPDPDLSNFGPGNGPGGGIFGDIDIDPDDPEVQAAFEACEDELPGFGRFGSGPRGGSE